MRIKTYNSLQKNTIFYLLLILILLTAKVTAQNDTIFFDKQLEICDKENAISYRIKPLKIKTKDALGYRIKGNDSLFVLTNHYLNGKIQFKGYSQDYDGNYLLGTPRWCQYDTNNCYEINNFNKEPIDYKIMIHNILDFLNGAPRFRWNYKLEDIDKL